MRYTFSLILLLFVSAASAQTANRWQQAISYKMDVSLDVNTHRYNGTQTFSYTNNSPDTLDRVFIHLYFNAFQPGSMMDVRSRSIADPDRRVGDRIGSLSESEQGMLEVSQLKMNGKNVKSMMLEGTVLEVMLAEPIMPRSTVNFSSVFNGQVPVQVRRSGRNSAEGIAYTMTQWFPKMAEYDYEGWHADPYVARGFHGVWGDFDVTITLDENYTVAASGELQNAKKIGHGYAGIQEKKKGKKGMHSWNFVAKNVHDFAWSADPEYVHITRQVPNGPMLHFFYQGGEEYSARWEELPAYTERLFQRASDLYGKYPYPVYSVAQGGDGGMEYAMITMITGNRSLGSLVGVTVHEAMHSWYQHVLGFNEAKYPWMDEGFTSYASAIIENELFDQNAANPLAGSYAANVRLLNSGNYEPMTTHSDMYNRNSTYSINAYVRGAIFLHQMEYIIGKETFDRAILRLFDTWKFKHPNPNDVVRVFEKESGLELSWYLDQWTGTTNSIDYGIRDVAANGERTRVVLERNGNMPMPLDVVITKTDGSKEYHNIPLQIMRGEKTQDYFGALNVLPDWPWVYPQYSFSLPYAMSEIESIEIDPTGRLADIEPSNNMWQRGAAPLRLEVTR
jgi:hypothetical protein